MNNNQYNNGYNNMNYQYNNRKPLSHYIKNFLLILLGFILLLFILLWIFPTKSSIKDSIAEALNPLYDRIYQDNLNNMKDAAITYYTTDRLPKEEGDSEKLTLGEMLDKHLLLEVKDKNGKMCDSEKSYVEITKDSKEYRMKVNLKCGEEEKYIIVYLGCYSYCDSDICEKKTAQEVITDTTVIDNIIENVTPKSRKHYCEILNGKYYDSNGKVVGKATYQKSCEHKPDPTPKYYCKIVGGKYYDKNGNIVSKEKYEASCHKPDPTPKYYCKIVDGKYYDKNGNIVSKEEYDASCNPEKKHYCEIVDGKYYDKNGNIVTKEEYDASCNPTPKYYCKIVDGKYYDKNGNIVTKEEYEKSCHKPDPEPKYYCKIVDGKYYDKNGNIVSKEEYDASCNPEPEKKYKYKYEKEETIHHDTEYSKWTEWSENIEYDPNNNNINWGEHELEWNEKVGYKTITNYETDKTKPIWQTVNKQIGTYSQWACDEYDYFIDSTTQTTYTTTTSEGGWTYAGTITASQIPTSTNTIKYVFAGMSYSNCGTLCDVSPVYKFAKYTRTANTSTTSSSNSTSESLSAVCKKVVKKDIPVYANLEEIVGYGVKKISKNVYYYHKKTRIILEEAYDEKKKYVAWSYSKEDEALIKDGYQYTGIYIII